MDIPQNYPPVDSLMWRKEMTSTWAEAHGVEADEPPMFAADVEVNYDFLEALPILESVYGRRLWLFTVIYLCVVFGGMKLMEKRPPYKLKTLLIVWNFLLAVMSIAGAVRMVPKALASIHHFGFYPSVCIGLTFTDNVRAFWSMIFTVSKLAEFGDTFLLVARKRPVIFLHWYHHISVLFFSYYSYTRVASVAEWFVVINFLVHSIMYSYYFLRALSVRVPKFVSMAVTSLQIVQMISACLLVSLALYYRVSGMPCCVTGAEAAAFLAIYLSFFALFGKFFVESYMKPTSGQSKKKRID